MTDLRKRKDWQLGIEPTPAELAAQVKRVREVTQECRDIIDELFPEVEEERKPLGKPPRIFGMFPTPGHAFAARDAAIAAEEAAGRGEEHD